MKPSSSPFDGLLGPLSGAPDVDAALGDAALLRALLDVEAALARAGVRTGLIPEEAGAAIAAACGGTDWDVDALGQAAVTSGSPVVPLVRAIVAAVPASARGFVHLGATSQDVVDTALVLVVRRALVPIDAALLAAADACAVLAEEHRSTVMVARTLGQQALPTTFGLRAAGWLAALDDARAALAHASGRLCVQFGGAAGTLASLGADGVTVLSALGTELQLPVPTVPWHTARGRVIELAGALAATSAALGKIAGDVVLLAQTEVGEVGEAGAAGDGTSSTLPQKRNPIASVLARAGTQRLPGVLATLFAGGGHEHERAAGAWHAEWQPLREALHLVGGAAVRVQHVVTDLDVHRDRMRANLDATRGGLMAESVAARLAPALGRTCANDLVARLCRQALDTDSDLREVLLDSTEIRAHLAAADIDAALDPAGYLGSSNDFIDRALQAHRISRAPRE
jgi:3-carboxy-cis,cis-muconate cycloisomerase